MIWGEEIENGKKWTSRAFREGDETGIFELWKAVHPDRQYHQEKWLKWWRWMYQENPAGDCVIWLAEDNNKIVGQYAIIPVRLKFGDETILGAQSIDTMTHPDYRRQGIFENLAKSVYKESATRGIRIIYGFPNEFSHPGFIKKLQWFDVSPMLFMIKPFNWEKVIKLKIKNQLLRAVLASGAGLVYDKLFFRTRKTLNVEGLTVNKIISFDERFDEFSQKICDRSKIIAMRSSDYLNWRYSRPETNYSIYVAERDLKICGYIVFQNKIQSGVRTSSIFDIKAQSEEILHCLILRTIMELKKESDMLSYTHITNDIYNGVFKKNGFIPLPFVKSGYFCVYSALTSSSNKFMFNPNNWMIQTGDSDRESGDI